MSIEERLIRCEYSQVECYEMGKLDAFKEMKVDDKGYQIGYNNAIEEICDWLTKHTFRNVNGEYIHGGFIAEELRKIRENNYESLAQ